MKRYLTILLILLTASFAAYADKTYDVEEVYEKQDLPRDAKVLDKWDNIKDAKCVLIPADMRRGEYEVTVTRIDTNIYQVERTDYIIVTKFCYEFARYQKAILKYESSYGYTRGKLTFIE